MEIIEKVKQIRRKKTPQTEHTFAKFLKLQKY